MPFSMMSLQQRNNIGFQKVSSREKTMRRKGKAAKNRYRGLGQKVHSRIRYGGIRRKGSSDSQHQNPGKRELLTSGNRKYSRVVALMAWLEEKGVCEGGSVGQREWV